MPGVWARTSLITTSAPPGISVKCTFVVSPRGNARKRAGQAQHAYPWPRDGLVPRVRSSMERVRAGEGDPDRAGGTPATPRSRAPVPKTARTNARSPHLTYAPVRKTRSSSPASSPFFAAARAAAGPSAMRVNSLRTSLILSSHSGEWRVRSNAAPRDGEFSRAHGHISE